LNGRDLESRLMASLPALRGRLKAEAPLKDLTWFRAGGPAEVLYSPADESDLAYFMKATPTDIPVTVIGLGSNLLVRDGGIAGVVIRLGRGFGEITIEDGHRVRAGTAVPDVKVARPPEAGIAGLFYRGIPGCVGAARMAARKRGRKGSHRARAVDRAISVCCRSPSLAAIDTGRRTPVFTGLCSGRTGGAKILAEMDEISAYREEVQRSEPTGGSTLESPGQGLAYRRAGCRGLSVGVPGLRMPQFSQRGERLRRRSRDARRDGTRTGQGDERGRARMGDQAPRQPGVIGLIVRRGCVPCLSAVWRQTSGTV
jgi:UDP-N-acetylmuramate dehydrogenase